MSLADKFNVPQTLHDYILSVMKEETEYQAKVKALMAKKGIKSLADLSPDEKKAFFSQLDSMHKAKNEEVDAEDEMDDEEDDKKKKKKKSEDDEEETNDVDEASSPAQQAAIAIAMKKDGKKPKDMQEAPVGGGTSIKGNEADRAKATAERAKLTMQAAQLRIKQAKEREALSKKKKAVKEETSIEESFSDAQIAKLKAEYSKINTIDPSGDGYKKLTAMLDKLDKPTLEKLAGAGIKFVSGLAKNRVNRMKNEAVVKGKGYDNPDNERKGPEGKVPMTSLMPGHSDKAARFAAVQAKGRLVKGKAQSAPQKEEVELDESGDMGPSNKGKEKPVMMRHKTSGREIVVVPSGVKEKQKLGYEIVKEESKLEEGKSSTGYNLYHKDFSSAMAHAYDFAKNKYGIEVDPEEIDRKVAMGPKKPSSGKTNSYRLMGKDGKKAIQVQVANLDNKRYELNMYKEEVDLNKVFFEAMKKDKKEATAKDKSKTVKAGDKLSGKQEPVELEPELKEETK
jgi:hypothetical protein